MKYTSLHIYLVLHMLACTGSYLQAQHAGNDSLNFEKLLLPVPKASAFRDTGYYIWCGTMIRTEDGLCHLFYSRWPKAKGFSGWVTDSEIAHAVSRNPSGPYTFRNLVLPKRDKRYWDADVTHNPTVMKFGKKYYLYYMGNAGDGSYWNHRNHQRIGVAVADHPNGPWKRSDTPVVDVTPGSWDHLMTSNPSVARGHDGKYLMVYKGVADGTLPAGGKVRHGVAVSARPEGPFIKQPGNVFDQEGVNFAAEDPFIWVEKGGYYAIVKDMKGSFTKAGTSLALFRSDNGLVWKVASHPLVTGLAVKWADGREQKMDRVERPQLWFEHGRPSVLFVAVKESDSLTYNLAIPLKK